MKSFLNSCNNSQPADPAEVKAILFAAGACILFIGFLTAVHRSEQRHNRTTVVTRYTVPDSAMPVPPVTITEPPPPPVPDLNARFRVVPANFRGINFMTRNYGTYEFSNGTNRDLVLIDGKARDVENSQQQWFDVNDVLFTDLTGDGRPEAIVMLTHLQCARQCDGGKNLLYVYSHEGGILTEILKYESGSGMDGCSLKSLTVKNKQLTLDLFGDCPSNILVIRDLYKLTRVEFFFNGKKLVQKKVTLLDVPDRNEVSYGVEVHISDHRTPDQRDL